MQKVLKLIDRINEYTGKTVSFLVILMVFIILYEIVARYIFNRPTIWAHELSQMVFGTYVMLLGGFLLVNDGHVNVEILYRKFSPRLRAVVDLYMACIYCLRWRAYD